jgi:hypothetical protein
MKMDDYWTRIVKSLAKHGIVSFAAIVLAGCSTTPPQVQREHVIVVNKFGQSLYPETNAITHGPFMHRETTNDFESHIMAITNSVAGYAAASTAPVKILIFIHGGMNTFADGMSNATNDIPQIAASGYYPLFICWDSSLWGSYGEHLVSVRQGARVGPVTGWLTMPFCLAADLGTAMSRAPLVFYYQFYDDLSTFSLHAVVHGSEEDNRRKVTMTDTGPGLHLQIGADRRTTADEWEHGSSYALTFVPKLLTAPIIDACGRASWDIMCRRTQVMFYTANQFSQPQEMDALDAAKRRVGEQPEGGVGRLLQSLSDLISNDKSHHYAITLVGHSMGAIIANEMLKTYPDLPYSNIVYMAAACSEQDFADSVIPYLARTTNANFYGLTLHPIAEARETHWSYAELSPRGSLLEWIDNFLSNPVTIPERTNGKWDNLISTTPLIPRKVANQIHLKAFSVGPTDLVPTNTPQAHGDFSQEPFWLESFWTNKPDMDIPSTR